MNISDYLQDLGKNLAHGDATESTHRPALKSLLETQDKGVTATNEPKRIACGAPDFSVSRKTVPFGYVETKDIGTGLDEMERGRGPYGEQFRRYKDGLPNWVLTDYLEFRWYVNGEKKLSAKLGALDGKKRIAANATGPDELSKLLHAFYSEPALTVESAKDLARRMAGMTSIIRELISATFDHGSPGEQRQLQYWLKAFRKSLLPDLDTAKFADMFAQTMAYGLFAARVHSLNAAKPFTRETAASNLPRTNPFLRTLFDEIAGVKMPDTFGWAVDAIVELLNHANWGRILKDFGKGTGKHDPVVHFYETFLSAYDPKLRELRGVYYTPEAVVSYIVRSVEHLLKTRFGRPKGLADNKTLILDPAAGTGTFLFSTIDQIHKKFTLQKGAWDSYVSEHLLDRVFGFELLMAPYAVAHLKLGMQLQETGYKFGTDQRLGIYLTNTLEEAAQKGEELVAQWISDEANAASAIKRDKEIWVILGNPPYSGISANRGQWITDLLKSYRKVDGQPLGEKKVWLKNDYVKFIRFGQWRIERTGAGILAFITDHSYLDSPTFRGMRQELMKVFDEIFILNLHGNQKRREQAPDGGKDVNVFDITQGVAISIYVKREKPAEQRVYYADLFGLRPFKYETLFKEDVSSTEWQNISPHSPSFDFVYVSEHASAEYDKGFSIRDIFPLGSNGVQTSRDELTVAFTHAELSKRLEQLVDEHVSDNELRDAFFTDREGGDYPAGDSDFWTLPTARQSLRKNPAAKEAIIPYLYRPFDVRSLLYLDAVVHRRRTEVMLHLTHPNLALCVGRAGLVASGEWNLAFCAKQICDHNLFYRGSSLNFPLYLYPQKVAKRLFDAGDTREANISALFRDAVSEKLKLAFQEHGSGDFKKTIGPEDIYHYIYALLYSPAYRQRYAEFLRKDFPRIPITGEPKLFANLAEKGSQLAALHLFDSPELDELITDFPERGDNVVEKIVFVPEKERVWINREQFFDGVTEEVWHFQIGGYQVCEKWLKDRKGQKLSYNDSEHWQKIVVAVTRTMEIMEEIDELIPGWPLR